MTPQRRRVSAAGATAALILAASGALLPGAAIADDEAAAPTSGATFDANAKALLTSDGVEAVTANAEGQVVVYTTASADSLDATADAFVNDYSNVIVEVLDAPFSSLAATDVVGGAGYFGFNPATPEAAGSLCSIGFSAWNPDGDPAIVSAGHCTSDGTFTASLLTLPSGDDAAGGEEPAPFAPLASLTFSQYGGPGNSAGAVGDRSSSDVSTWDIVNADLDTRPLVTDWKTADQNDLSLSTVPVRAVGSAQVGAAVTKSGRTTGFTSGTVIGINGWANVSGRQVFGFMTDVPSAEGDSGGAVLQGNSAVGILSGGSTQDGAPRMFAADLQNALTLTDGYTVALFLDAPVVTSAAQLGVGGTVTGTGPANATLVVTPEGGTPFDVAIGADGSWSFPAPAEVGETSYTAVARSGFDESAVTPFDVDVLPAAPAITSPANGARIVSEVTEITGTGVAGATVTLSGDVAGDATVEEDGTWSFPVDLGIDAYSITAVQEVEGVTSATSTSAFAVIPTAPVVDAPLAGRTYAFAEAPAAANGTGIEDASISVLRNGQAVGSTIVTDGAWNVALTAQAGDTVLEVVQTVNGQSNSTVVSYAVAAAPVAGGGAGGGADGAAPGAGAGSGDPLAATGGGDPTPFAALGLGMLVIGAALVTARRLRTRTNA